MRECLVLQTFRFFYLFFWSFWPETRWPMIVASSPAGNGLLTEVDGIDPDAALMRDQLIGVSLFDVLNPPLFNVQGHVRVR